MPQPIDNILAVCGIMLPLFFANRFNSSYTHMLDLVRQRSANFSCFSQKDNVIFVADSSCLSRQKDRRFCRLLGLRSIYFGALLAMYLFVYDMLACYCLVYMYQIKIFHDWIQKFLFSRMLHFFCTLGLDK